MAQRQVRSQVAIVTTSLGLAVLLAGPAATFGLGGIPIVGGSDSPVNQVTSTVQGLAETTQQAAATTVTNVESTVQATTQPPASQQPAASQVQTNVTEAPKQAVARVTEPVKNHVPAIAQPRTPAGHSVVPAESVKKTAASVPEAFRRHTAVASDPILPRATRLTKTPAPSTAADAPTTQCVALPLLDLLPGGAQVKALLGIVCDAAAGLFPGRIGANQPAGAGPGLGGAPGATSSVPARHGRGRSAVPGGRAPGGASRRAGPTTEPSAMSASVVGAIGAAVAGRAGDLPHIDAAPAAQRTHGAGSGSGRKAAAERHHGFFAGQPSGTTVLIGILILNLAILGGIAVWRMAVRWVLPRFA
jgi:hypothetical protein